MMIRLVVSGLILVGAACAQTNEGKLSVDMGKIDWRSLQFSCVQEKKPPLDAEADVWFKRARALQKQDAEANEKEIARLYQQAVGRGHYKAMINLANLYVYGAGVPRDEDKAVDLVEQALALQAPPAYYAMAVFLQQGIGVKQDRTAALAYFRKSADLGERHGQLAAGQFLRAAFIKQPEPERSRAFAIAVQMFECSLEQGFSDAGYELGMHYSYYEDNPHKGLAYFQKAGALGHVQSLYSLYATFKDGKNGFEKDPKRAACYDQLWREADDDASKRFPDIDRICPLPPPPAREGQSSQTAPRVGLWQKSDDPSVMFTARGGEALPHFQGQAVDWVWIEHPLGKLEGSGNPCPYPGYWACQDLPTGERYFGFNEVLPEVEGRPVRWKLMRTV